VTVQRGGDRSAHAFLPAPYGTYPTSDGYLSLAMNPVPVIGKLLGIDYLESLVDEQTWWDERDQIEQLLAAHLQTESTEHWLTLLDAADVWCAPVLTLEELVAHPGFASIQMTQQVHRSADVTASGQELALTTTRSPIRIDGHILTNPAAAPKLGQHNEQLAAVGHRP
jgi:crotonobetainyl-CoA:carnitine CoA-transferase CaiB-like acyl-CoA transferase